MSTALWLVAVGAIIGLSTEEPRVEVEATYPAVVAGADAVQADFHFKNESPTTTWCLVWYDRSTAYIDPAERTLLYVEDLDRDPELASCGGTNAFQAPSYRCIAPGEVSQQSVRVWAVPAPRSVAEIAKNVGRPRDRVALVPGGWTLVARFALLEKGMVPKSLSGIELCKYLSASERHVQTSEAISIRADAVDAWASRRKALADVTGQQVHDQYLLDRYVEFFEALTGTESGLRDAPGGRVLDRALLDAALRKWDAWYRANGNFLKWNPSEQRYVATSDRK